MQDDAVFGIEFQQWIREHVSDDPDRLRLSFHGDPRPWIPYAITQIASLRRAEKKFHTADGQSFVPEVIASDIALQQSTSADIAMLHASLLAGRVAGDSDVLDMTCGLGTDTRALSHYFNVTACELNPLHAAMARANFRDNPRVNIVEADSVEYLRSVGSGRFAAVFIDPARRDDLGRRVYGIRDCTPDITEILPLLQAVQPVVMCKLSPMIDVSRTLIDIPHVSDVHIIGDGRECKELVVVVDRKRCPGSIADTPVSLWSTPQRCDLRYTISDEAAAVPLPYMCPGIGDTLWIPGSVAMKGGCFNLLSSTFEINPVAPNTHIYTSSGNAKTGFPGHGEAVIDVIPWKSSELKALKKKKIRAGARVRNFGLTAQQLSDKLGLSNGSDTTMITGMTLAGGSRVLVVSTRY